MRFLLPLLLLSPFTASACTAFLLHDGGRTFVGNNEDSWCVEGRVRFVPGEAGRLGAVYFSSWRGHPYLPWADQLGMNEAGLVFDGLIVQPKDVAPLPGKPALEFGVLTNLMLEQCRDVPEAVAFLQKHDLTLLHKSMIFLADAQGRYAVVQNDTLLTGNDPYFAVGNWRMGRDTDMEAIPIPRLQQGRALLKAGVAPTVEGAWSVLEEMKSCRKFLENGTFFSTLFEPDSGRVHVAFYHDYDHRITFDLHEELRKGAHTLDLPSLFPPNKAFQALQAYRTPFHQHWLFWALASIAIIAIVLGLIGGVLVLARAIGKVRGKSVAPWWPPFVVGLSMLLVCALITIFLTNENVFYFGLSDMHFALGLLPIIVLSLGVVVARRAIRTRTDRWILVPTGLLLLPIVLLCGYWGLLWP